MSSFLRQTVRAALLLGVVIGMGATSPAGANKTGTPAVGESATAGWMPEVRLRKLHLVRPDLIPYPIAYEVCC
jgi:hypothetical protein